MDMMLECLQRPEQSVADSALQYLTSLDFVPMADRVCCTPPPPRNPPQAQQHVCRQCHKYSEASKILVTEIYPIKSSPRWVQSPGPALD